MHFQTFPGAGQNVAQNASRGAFSNISRGMPECLPRRLPEMYFPAFPAAGQNVGPEGFQRCIFKRSRRRPECRRRLPEMHFQQFPGAGQNVGSEGCQRCIFKRSQWQARLSAQKASRDAFPNISSGRPECRPRRFQICIFKHFQRHARHFQGHARLMYCIMLHTFNHLLLLVMTRRSFLGKMAILCDTLCKIEFRRPFRSIH